MTVKKPTESLVQAIRMPGFNPRRVDLDALIVLLGSADDEDVDHAERALVRMGGEVVTEAMKRFDPSRPPLRARLCRLVGRIAASSTTAEGSQPRASEGFPVARAFLEQCLRDDDAKTRRNAIIALGKLGGEGVEKALLETWERDPSVAAHRSIAAALGKIGGARSLDLLRAVNTDDRELARIRDEATLKIGRTLGRSDDVVRGTIDPVARANRSLELRVHCRRGLEPIVSGEMSEGLNPRSGGEGFVAATLPKGSSLEALQRLRTALRFGFPLERASGKSADVVVRALTSPLADEIFRTFTRGAARYRLEWASAGHRRKDTWEVARAVAKLRPALINDPTDTLWEVVITERGASVDVELWPRGLVDERFAYRLADIPASSHPTIAAALARVGCGVFAAGASAGAVSVRPDDVVWDPFVGAATELIERARLGPARFLGGCDTSPEAIEIARGNLRAAKVTAEVSLGDARTFRPSTSATRVSLILSNPPMGRRVLHRDALPALLDAVLAHAATITRPGARLVWVSPLFQRTVDTAERVGFTLEWRSVIDMGGFPAELQSFVRRA